MRTIIAALLALALSPATALAAAGDLDPAFDGDGKLTFPVAAVPTAILVQPDGKIVLAGNTADDLMVWRLHADGSPDPSFDRDGAAVIDLGARENLEAAVLQPDGRIVLAATVYYGEVESDMAVARLDTDGSLDETFAPGGADGDGKRVFGSEDDVRAKGVAIQPYDGKIVLAALSTGDPNFVLTRVTSTGAPDATVFADSPNLADEYYLDVAVQSDGAIVVTGEGALMPENLWGGVVVRYTPQGALDGTFARAGVQRVPDIEPVRLLIRPNGTVVVAGTAGADQRSEAAVTQLTGRGELITAFGAGGTATAEFTGPASMQDAVLQPDGKVVVTGLAQYESAFAVARIGATGAPDGGFGAAGKATVPFGDVTASTSIALQPDGKVVVGGVTATAGVIRLAVARLLGEAAPVVQQPGPSGTPAVPRCAGRPATVVGTARRDVLRGTRRADVIVALGGDDRVIARGGNDVVCGGAGNDRLSGGAGRDRLLGERGRDRLLGGGGRDRLVGGPGRDRARQ